MLSFLKKIFADDDADYEAQKRKLDSGEPQQLLALARNEKTSPEILYLLAGNQSVEIRRSVAANKSTPVQAATIMARDKNTDVRIALAARLVTLLPDLTAKEHAQLYSFAVQALGTLAQDEVVQVRKALSDVLRDHTDAPAEVVNRLARDVERVVSEPILRFCLALADEEIIDILKNHPESWVISSLAGRPRVSEAVAGAIMDTEDSSAISTLLNNPACILAVDRLYEIIERAHDYPDWHRPIALRPELSADLAHRLAGFVDKSILEVLEKRSDFDPETKRLVSDIVKRRLVFLSETTPPEAAAARVERFAREKRLTVESIQDALAWHDHEFAVLALSYLSGIHAQVVRRMVETRKAKPVVALCRKANVPMRLAVDVQRHLAKVPRNEILYAKDGRDYPMTDDEIKWQLEFFGVQGVVP